MLSNNTSQIPPLLPPQPREETNRPAAIGSLGQVWRWWTLHTMVEPTPLGTEIFFALAQAGLSGKALRMKELLADLPHAQSAIRKTLKKLEDEGWIIFGSVANDKRAKTVIPAEKFILYADEFLSIASDHLRKYF